MMSRAVACRFVLLLLAALWGLVPSAQAQAQGDAVVQQQKLNRVYQLLERLYVDDVEMAPLVESAITAMLEELDPHSAYLGAEEMKGVQVSFDGEFSGIGVEFSLLRDTIVVANTIAGGPAEQVGVLPNDRIVRIDTLDAVGMRMGDVPRYLRGERGTKVGIDVMRHGVAGQLHFVITRDRIPLNTVDAAYMPAEGIGYIKINRFGRTTMTEFLEAFHGFDRCEGLIVDLRGNGGGLLEQAILLAEFLLPRGSTIVSTEGRAVTPTSFEARGGEKFRGNLVVLIDESSASASEIVSGAVQDWDRGVIVAGRASARGSCSGRFRWVTARRSASPSRATTPPRAASSSAPMRTASGASTTSTICGATTTGCATRSTPGLRSMRRSGAIARCGAAEASLPT